MPEMQHNRTEACVITFIGPVGVGKSTQIRLTRRLLAKKGRKTKTTFIKSSHALTYVLIRTLKILGAKERVRYADTVRIYPRRNVIQKLFPLYRFLDALSISLKFLSNVCVPYSMGSTILLEEGPIMSLHTYAEVMPRLYGTRPTVLPFVPNMIGWIENRNHINLILEANEKELNQRRKTREFRRSELSEYEKLQKNWIQKLNLRNTVVIDTTHIPAKEVQKQIASALNVD